MCCVCCSAQTQMGYFLANSCRRCGGAIAVKSKEERALKDAQGVDVHAYEKVCERVRAAAG